MVFSVNYSISVTCAVPPLPASGHGYLTACGTPTASDHMEVTNEKSELLQTIRALKAQQAAASSRDQAEIAAAEEVVEEPKLELEVDMQVLNGVTHPSSVQHIHLSSPAQREDTYANQRDDDNRRDHNPVHRATNRAAVAELLSNSTLTASLDLGHGLRIQLTNDSITDVAADAVVNAANETLEGGGGVDQAIHAVAGQELRAACVAIPLVTVSQVGGAIHVGERARCPVGEARVTPAFNLPHAKHIIHTVAPLLDENGHPRAERLQSCYIECLKAAAAAECASVAFCALGTGYYGFPQVPAAEIAISTTRQWLLGSEMSTLKTVIFCMYGSNDEKIYPAVLGSVGLTTPSA